MSDIQKDMCIISLLLSQRNFVEEKLGVKYTEGRKTEFAKSYRESGPASPVFFILSPGVDPLKDVESLGILVETYRHLKQYKTNALWIHTTHSHSCAIIE